MDAIVTAGGIPQEKDPLYEYTRGIPKALLDVAGKPMIQWVLDALNGVDEVEHIVVIGLDDVSGLVSNKPLLQMPNQGNMLENIITGAQKVLEVNPSADLVLIVSSDIPTITPEVVRWMIHTAEGTDHDVYYTVVTNDTMENRFPKSKRSYVPFRDMRICGGDLNAFHVRIVTMSQKTALLRTLIEARKNVFKQASILGWDTLLLLLLRQLTLHEAIRRASNALKLNATAVVSPFAELAMDVDKPSQLEMLSADLARSTRG